MADAVPTSGFSVPPAPGAHERQPAPAAPAPAPAAPAPVAPQPLTQADLQAVIAQLAPQAPAPATPAAPVQNQPQFVANEDMPNDPVLASFTQAFTAIAQGVDIQRAIGNALTHGNPALIDMAYLAEKGGAQAEQLKTIAKAIVDRVQSQTAEAASAVYDAAGGQEHWTAAAAAFSQSAPPHLKLVVKQLLESGNREGVKAGAQTVIDFVRQGGLVVVPGKQVQAGGGMAAAQALSKEQFQTELFKLDKNSRTFEQDRATLFARRQAGKQLGL